ncbi:Phospholipid transfer protein [Collichthys lucidus]|uniref:Phospholipid transfer protein n=1 Tax=Collichthys lucidus TaxID=240159 RepID=A0A4U5TTX6_COLLU|nr:Phospholipid transfer protein [Collichthys lucidus]
MTPCLLSILFLHFFVCSVMSVTEPAGCKIRFTDKGLDMLKYETLKFVEEELSNISMPEMKGQDGHFQYNITEYNYNMIFKGMFFDLSNQNDTLKNSAIDPVIREYSRMVYLALSEFFFDSGMFAYYKAGIFQMHIVNEKMPKDLEMLLRTTYFGAIIMLNPALVDAPLSLQLAVNSPPKTTIKTSGATVVMTAIVQVMVLPPGQPPVQLSSMTMYFPQPSFLDCIEPVSQQTMTVGLALNKPTTSILIFGP